MRRDGRPPAFRQEDQSPLFSQTDWQEAIIGDRFNPKGPGMFDGGVNLVPCWLARREDVAASVKLLYGVLVRFCDKRSALAFPSNADLAKAVGSTDRAVRKWLVELENLRLISIERRGCNQTNTYGFLVHDWMYDDQ